MTHPAVIIERKTISLRDKFKKLEKNAKKNDHTHRAKFYNFIQTRLKRFGNWFFTLWSEEIQELLSNYSVQSRARAGSHAPLDQDTRMGG